MLRRVIELLSEVGLMLVHFTELLDGLMMVRHVVNGEVKDFADG
jgi:hypothetical protein